MKKLLFTMTLVFSCAAQATALSVTPVNEELYKEVQKAFEQRETLEQQHARASQQIIIEKLEVLHQDLVKIHAAILTSEQKCETDELVSQDK